VKKTNKSVAFKYLDGQYTPNSDNIKEAQLLVGALQEFHVLSDLGGDIEDHEVGEIYTRLQRQALGE
jgi:hypothetical protein